MFKWKIKLHYSVKKSKDSPLNSDKFKLSIQDTNKIYNNFRKLSGTYK